MCVHAHMSFYFNNFWLAFEAGFVQNSHGYRFAQHKPPEIWITLRSPIRFLLDEMRGIIDELEAGDFALGPAPPDLSFNAVAEAKHEIFRNPDRENGHDAGAGLRNFDNATFKGMHTAAIEKQFRAGENRQARIAPDGPLGNGVRYRNDGTFRTILTRPTWHGTCKPAGS